jgi:hypothetical protein
LAVEIEGAEQTRFSTRLMDAQVAAKAVRLSLVLRGVNQTP